MSRSATAKRKRQVRKATKQLNLVSELNALEPIDLSEAAFVRRQAKKQQQANANGPRNLSMAWDDTSLGVGATQTRDGLLDEKERKDTYYKVYLGNQWVSGCANVIAKRITSGGWECVEVEQGQGNPDNKVAIDNLLRFENLEEDFQQFLRSIAVDILVFGEAYCELVWSGGVVVGLYVIDAVSMATHFDKHGTVLRYVQSLERSTETVTFEPDQIIRWWLPDPRAKKKALSPIEHLKDPVYLEQSMITWVEKFFKQGTRPNYSVELGPDTGLEDAQRYVKFFKENYTGIQNAHVPPVMYGGGKLVESGKGTIDIDFDKGQDKQRDRVLAVYGVPPAELNIIESGNIGGGTGESQNKSFIYNTVMPLEQIILEKFNYRVIKKGLGIEDWKVKTRHADYRDDTEISDIEDKGIRNGTLLIDEARGERGRLPVPGGDEAVIVTSKEIVPVARLKELADEQAQTAQLGIEMQKAQVDKAKEPTPPPQIAAPGQQPPDSNSSPPNGNQQQGQGDNQQDDSDEQDDNAKEALIRQYLDRERAHWQNERLQESSHTGVMLAFFLKPSEAQQLVLLGGEPIDELHCTLAYLGDSSELGDLDELKQVVANYAKNASTLKGVVSGIGRFLAVQDGDPTPVYASVDSPGLPEWRQGLVDALRSADFPPNMQHGYSPHCTLMYLDKSVPMPIDTVATIPLNFDTLWLAIGDDRYAFSLDKTEEGYNPDQPRDAHGRFGSGGDSSVPSDSERIAKLNNLMAMRYPGTHFDFSDCDVETAKKAATQLDTLFHEYPEIAKTIPYVGTHGIGEKYDPHFEKSEGGAIACIMEGRVGGEAYTPMFLNTKYFGNPSKLEEAEMQEAYATCKKSGWLATDSVEATITHEFGHAVHSYIEKNRGGKDAEALNEFIEKNRKSAKTVSRYAATDDHESIAEAFASYHHNPKPPLYARKLRNVLNPIIRR